MVTYRPDGGFPERLSLIAAQVRRVVVVDNGSGTDTRRMLVELARSTPSVTLELLDSNEGIGAALNHGVECAISAGFAWVITFDQDTIVEPSLVAELASIHAEHPRREMIGVIASNFRAGLHELDIAFSTTGGRWHETATTITSGSMISGPAFERAGWFREDYFIDSVDEEFCLRVRRHKMLVVVSTRPLMHHSVGSREIHRLLGVRFVTSHHAAFRRYYMMRNRALTLRAFALREPRWAASRVWLTVTELALTPLLESDGPAKLKAMLSGLLDGVLGRSGRTDRVF